MPDSYACLLYHIVFSTKERQPWITQDIEQRVWSYLGAIADRQGMTPLQIGGLEDHVHVVVGIPPTLAISKAVQMLKGASSRWIRMTFSELDTFGWQDGYGAFTVSKSQLDVTIRYVKNQRARHEQMTFVAEYRVLLDRHSIPYDPRYVRD
ncbi:MAG: IS200/IS605 family transposase [Chloroflexota bacterium]